MTLRVVFELLNFFKHIYYLSIIIIKNDFSGFTKHNMLMD